MKRKKIELQILPDKLFFFFFLWVLIFCQLSTTVTFDYSYCLLFCFEVIWWYATEKMSFLKLWVIYIYKYISMVNSISYQTFFCTGISNWRTLLKIQYVIAIHIIRWLIKFYNIRFKWTATAGIGIYPSKAWLSQLLNFKNPIWTWGHFRRTIRNKIMF